VLLTVQPISIRQHLEFLRTQRAVSFLQTPAWGRVKTEWRGESLGWLDGSRLVGAGLVLHRPVPVVERFTLAYLAEGPVTDRTDEIERWLDPLAAYLKAHDAFAIRLGPPARRNTWSAGDVKAGIADPGVDRLTDLAGVADPAGARVVSQLHRTGWLPQSPVDGFGTVHPQFSYELALRHPDGRPRSEGDLLEGMNQLWRRNIKKAAQEGVKITIAPTLDDLWVEDLKAFHDLYVHTAARDRFSPRPLRYFEAMFAALKAEDPERIRLYLAHHQGDLVAAAILIRVGGQAWYAHGASSTVKREARGSNAVQWAMIRDALTAGCDVYSLRGITPTLDADSPYIGLIQFKVGTGGHAVRCVGEWDPPLRPMIYRAFDAYPKYRTGGERAGDDPESQRRLDMIPLALEEIASVAGGGVEGNVEGDRSVTVTAPAVLDGRRRSQVGCSLPLPVSVSTAMTTPTRPAVPARWLCSPHRRARRLGRTRCRRRSQRRSSPPGQVLVARRHRQGQGELVEGLAPAARPCSTPTILESSRCVPSPTGRCGPPDRPSTPTCACTTSSGPACPAVVCPADSRRFGAGHAAGPWRPSSAQRVGCRCGGSRGRRTSRCGRGRAGRHFPVEVAAGGARPRLRRDTAQRLLNTAPSGSMPPPVPMW
jgi:vancomycin resistance protein VanK